MKTSDGRIQWMLSVLLAFAVVGPAGCSSDTTSAPVDDDPVVVTQTYNLVDTGQDRCYDSDGNVIACPEPGERFHGQDAQYNGATPALTDNGDGTITDQVTGLMWQQTPPAFNGSWLGALDYCASLELAGHDDWRAPTLKELFSISDFSRGWPYLNTDYFDLADPVVSKDEQYWSSNNYLVGTTHGGQASAFGVNHGTGHIKAYPANTPPGPMGNKVRAVRGAVYGVNDFADNGDGIIIDRATGLMWMQADAGLALDWESALAYADSLSFGGYDDWRLPDVRELQSIVDYSGVFPAIDPMFSCTGIVNAGGLADFGYYWTGTSAYFGQNAPQYYYAWYVAFGYAVDEAGNDIHGAGAVRFDTKVEGGPLGEGGERFYNQVRCVRNVTE